MMHGRVCIFIDNSNLFHAIKTLKQGEMILDYVKLREYLANGRPADIRFYYSMPMSRPVDVEESRQFDKLLRFYSGIRQLGYEMIELPLRSRCINGGGLVPKEKGLDCEIVYDMATISRIWKYHSFVLVSGDEDYARTVRRIRDDVGMRVEVAFFSHAGCSNVLINEASRFIDLSRAIPSIFREIRQKQCVVA